MEKAKKTYWKGLEQLTNDPAFVEKEMNEFPQKLPMKDEEFGASRRDFLKMMGFSVAAASLAACEAPVRKAIPYLNKPVEVDPGVPLYYASSYMNGSDFCSIVVKTREGRPIKIEGNKLSAVSGGGTSAQVEASVLSLYDKQRIQNPTKGGSPLTWDELDKEVTEQLNSISTQGGQIRIVSNSIYSPSTLAALEEFKAKYPGTEVVTYDPRSNYGISKAHETTHGGAMVPAYDFSKAKTVVSFDADFLGTWVNPTLFSRQFAKTRKLNSKKKDMSRLYSFESNMSLTGANADYRMAIKPSQQGLYVASLYNMIAPAAGGAAISAGGVEDENLKKIANELLSARGTSLVVSGSNDPNIQTVINVINSLLGNYGATIDASKSINFRSGNDEAMEKFVADLSAGAIGGVIFYNCNPVYDYPKGAAIASNLNKAEISISTSDRLEETSSATTHQAPDNHFLESWNDAEAMTGHYSLSQPTISKLFNTRQAQESFLKWSGNQTTYYDYIKANWQANQFAAQSEESDFDKYFDKMLHDGVAMSGTIEEAAATEAAPIDVSAAGQAISSAYSASNSALELAIYETVAIGTGNQANNPWLQEMPDPVTKACWENYVTVSQKHAEELGIRMSEGLTQKVDLTVGGVTVSVPVVVQPGQAQGTVGLALGYGRKVSGPVANEIGIDANPLVQIVNGVRNYNISSGVSITATGESYKVAHTQTHSTHMDRHFVVQESVLSKYQEDEAAGRHNVVISTYKGKKPAYEVSLWEGHNYTNHHWGMVIDMNSCTGCGSCTIACQAENNVPVVGKEEVLNRREMTWLRIDRYYSSDAEHGDLKGLEKAAENPEVTFQPMMCQHCNNAPCETVCPVAATNHSTEGLNQMAYNRCIGTRYCANNCPYKVRRFNWFKYHDNSQFMDNLSMNNDLGKMVLNPDVTVRARGVMEKCTLCVQRIQYGKLEAKKEKRRVTDADVNTACAKACPSEAITFGDLLNPESQVSKTLKLEKKDGKLTVNEPRAYHVLEELAVKPNVWYLTKIRNKEQEA
ncbi:MAG: TAT-variant-translocated molybdopterin oxidoreductase [Cyclobacteriaceae bacterium]